MAQSTQKPERGILGQPAPRLDISKWIDGAGKPTAFDVGSLEGKWVFMKCFQSWCPGCHKMGFPSLKQFYDAFAEEPRVQAIAIQTVFEGFFTNTEEKVRDQQVRYDLPIVMGHDAGDPDGDHLPKTMKQYRTGGTPWIVVIDPRGVVVFNDFHINVGVAIEHIRSRLA
ncbi:MAG: TlpA disulfide reductase family protein [Pseudomonadota bacterium]